jgi:hypothetical protein
MLKRANKARSRRGTRDGPRAASLTPAGLALFQVAWNPREAFNFTVASEDNNLYSFDMRKLDIATNIHKDFVSVRTAHAQCARLRSWLAC